LFPLKKIKENQIKENQMMGMKEVKTFLRNTS
jgi:hypothetical protein